MPSARFLRLDGRAEEFDPAACEPSVVEMADGTVRTWLRLPDNRWVEKLGRHDLPTNLTDTNPELAALADDDLAVVLIPAPPRLKKGRGIQQLMCAPPSADYREIPDPTEKPIASDPAQPHLGDEKPVPSNAGTVTPEQTNPHAAPQIEMAPPSPLLADPDWIIGFRWMSGRLLDCGRAVARHSAMPRYQATLIATDWKQFLNGLAAHVYRVVEDGRNGPPIRAYWTFPDVNDAYQLACSAFDEKVADLAGPNDAMLAVLEGIHEKLSRWQPPAAAATPLADKPPETRPHAAALPSPTNSSEAIVKVVLTRVQEDGWLRDELLNRLAPPPEGVSVPKGLSPPDAPAEKPRAMNMSGNQAPPPPRDDKTSDSVNAAGSLTPEAPAPPVVLGKPGDKPIVRGKPKERLTLPRYNVVKALLDAGDNGLKGDDLVTKSGHSGAVNVLKALAKSDPDWGAVILLPGQPGARYRIVSNPNGG